MKFIFQLVWRHTINKLTFDGSNYSSEVVVGDDGGIKVITNDWQNTISFTEIYSLYPTELIADPSRNKMYVNFYG